MHSRRYTSVGTEVPGQLKDFEPWICLVEFLKDRPRLIRGSVVYDDNFEIVLFFCPKDLDESSRQFPEASLLVVVCRDDDGN